MKQNRLINSTITMFTLLLMFSGCQRGSNNDKTFLRPPLHAQPPPLHVELPEPRYRLIQVYLQSC